MAANIEDVPIYKKMFKSQIKELLSEVQFKKPLPFLNELCDAIRNTPKPDNLQLLEEGLSFVPQVPDHIKHFNFHSPSSVHIIGSHSLGTALKRPYAVCELAVEIPSKGLKDKLLRNHGFLYRRLVYLSSIGQHLLESWPNLVQSVQWDSDSDILRPDLLLTIKDNKNGRNRSIEWHRVRLTTVVSSQTFRLIRLRPDRSNLPHDSAAPSVSTPVYNSLLARDVCRLINYKFIKTLLDGESKICQGVVLFKVWLKQRGLLKNCCGGLSDELVDTLAAFLLQSDILNRVQSPYFVFQAILQYLSNNANWSTQGVQTFIDSNDEEEVETARPSLEVMRSAFPVVFVGASGYDNLTAHMSRVTFDWLIYEARQSLKYVRNENVSTFDSLFMTSQNVFEKFDHVIVIKSADLLTPIISDNCQRQLSSKLVDNCGYVPPVALPVLCQYLIRCLDKRLLGVHVDLDSLQQHYSSRPKDKPILIGLILNPELISLDVDKGPHCATEEAKQFRELWGNKSEMRHVDGDLRECLVWSSSTDQPNWNVTTEIVQFIMTKLLGLNCSFTDCHQVNPSLSPLTAYPQQVLRRLETKNQNDLSSTLTKTKDQLCALLRSLNAELPLDVTSVRSVTASCRGTDVFPPLPVGDELVTVTKKGSQVTVKRENKLYPVLAPVQHLIVSLEVSGKWPDELSLFYDMKKLFLIRIHSLLNTKNIHSKLHASGYLDVYKSGYLFRIHLAQAKESYLLRKVRSGVDLLEVDSPQSRAWDRLHLHLPHLSAILSGLVARWPHMFDSACRFAKRWLTGQCVQLFESCQADFSDDLLEFGMNEVVVELLVAACFLSPHPYTVPASDISAFLRFLRLLGHHDFEVQPLIVNFTDELSDIDLEEITTSFHKNRAQLPAMVIVTSVDRRGDVWTSNGPTKHGLKQLQMLARQTHAVLKELLLVKNSLNSIKAVFRADATDYDAIIELTFGAQSFHLQEKMDIPKKQALHFRNCFYYPSSDDWPRVLIDVDPIQHLIHTIRRSYGDACEVYHNCHGGEWIGIKWKSYSGDPDEAQLYHEQILQTIASLATDFVQSIKLYT